MAGAAARPTATAEAQVKRLRFTVSRLSGPVKTHILDIDCDRLHSQAIGELRPD